MSDPQKIIECTVCGEYHRLEYYGDCRNDDERFTYDDLIARFGEEGTGWEQVYDDQTSWGVY